MLPSSDDALAAAQAALLSALTGRAPAPSGFGQSGVQAMGEVLLAKRRRSMVRACPALPGALGRSFTTLFAEYAHVTNAPSSGDAGDDASRFLRWLAQRRPLTIELHRCALALKVEHGFPLRAMWIAAERRFLVAYRLPRRGTRYFSVGRS